MAGADPAPLRELGVPAALEVVELGEEWVARERRGGRGAAVLGDDAARPVYRQESAFPIRYLYFWASHSDWSIGLFSNVGSYIGHGSR